MQSSFLHLQGHTLQSHRLGVQVHSERVRLGLLSQEEAGLGVLGVGVKGGKGELLGKGDHGVLYGSGK